MDKDESPQTGARAARSAHETGGPATSGLQEGNVSHRKYIPDIGWDRLTPPDYSSPGTQVEPGDSLEAEAEGAGGGLGGGRAGAPHRPAVLTPAQAQEALADKAVPQAARHGHVGLPGLGQHPAEGRQEEKVQEGGHQRAHHLRGQAGGEALLTWPRAHAVTWARPQAGRHPGLTHPTAGVGLCALRPWGMLARPHSPASPSTRRRLRGHPPTHPLATLRPHHKAQTGSGGLGPMLGQCAGA